MFAFLDKLVFRVAGNILIYFVALGLLGSSFGKLLGEQTVVETIRLINFTDPIALGILELTCAVLLGIPTTRKIGILMCTAYIGGIIVGEQALNGRPIPGFFLMSVLWLGTFLRHPETFFDKPDDVKTFEG